MEKQDGTAMNERQSWNITAVFCLLIFGVCAATMLHRTRSFSERENRSLASRPEFTVSSVLDGSFEEDYESYLTDQFILRDTWISIKTAAQRATGQQEDNDVYFAADDYLIEKHTGVFTAQRAQANIAVLAEFAGQMSETYGADHVTVMIAPDAVDILADKLPALASPYDEREYLAQIEQALPEGIWLDLQTVLEQHASEQIYYRTDHHWTTLGAWYAWEAFAARQGLGEVRSDDYEVTTVTDSFEGTVAAKVGGKVHADSIETYTRREGASYLLTYNDTDDVRSTVYQESALDGRDKYSYFYGGNYAWVQAQTDAGTGRRILVIKDSYAHCFVPFLYDYYDTVDMLDIRYYNSPVSELLAANDYTDVLFLYHAAGFADDTSLTKLLT